MQTITLTFKLENLQLLDEVMHIFYLSKKQESYSFFEFSKKALKNQYLLLIKEIGEKIFLALETSKDFKDTETHIVLTIEEATLTKEAIYFFFNGLTVQEALNKNIEKNKYAREILNKIIDFLNNELNKK